MKPASQVPPGPDPAPYLGGGLVVQDGPGAGVFFPFHEPVTLLGRSGGCDIRLESPQVRPLHCLLTPNVDGVALRALSSEGVHVNGRPVTTARLNDGDLLSFGPMRCRVRLPVAQTGDDPVYESLRIQALAVATQQAALTEKEIQLADRAEALTRQEKQLANRLDQQRNQLLDLQDQISQARDKLRAKRNEFAALSEQQEIELAAGRADIDERRRRIERRESRLLGIVKRMKAVLRRRQRHADKQREQAEHEADVCRAELQAEREAIDEFRRQFHTQAEMQRGQLAVAGAKLATAEQALAAREAVVVGERKELTLGRKRLAAEQQRFNDERSREAYRRDALRRELQHLESRAAHARQWLEQCQPSQRPIAPAPIELPPTGDREQVLSHIAGELADQRLTLAEQMQRFCQTQSQWENDRSVVLADLDALAAIQQDRDRSLNLRELELADGEMQLDDGRAALMRLAARVEADRTRAAAEAGSWGLETSRELARVEARGREVAHREENLRELYQLWGRRRTTEVAAWRAAQAEHLRARDDWASLRDNWLRARIRLAEERQELAAKQLAVEQMRAEFLDVADRPRVAARRLERLRRHWLARFQSDGKDLRRLRAALVEEAEQLDARVVDLTRRESHLATRQVGAAELLSDAERQLALAAAQRMSFISREQELGELNGLLLHRIGQLQDQIEGLARLFIDEPRKSGRAA